MTVMEISPEAKTLIRKAQDWLVGKNPHWVRGMWGVVEGDGGEEFLFDDLESIHPEYWKSYEIEKEEWDGNGNPPVVVELLTPFKNVDEPTSGCLITGLLVANGYERDAAFYEAEKFLAALIEKSDKADKNPLPPEDRIIQWNDSQTRTEDDVRSLFRRAINRLRR